MLAQVIDVFHAAGGPAAALREISLRGGNWFDPSLVALFHDIARSGRLWEGLAAEGLEARAAALEPVTVLILLNETRLDEIAGAFTDIVDAKSSFTATHSRRVAAVTTAIATRLGLPEERRRCLHRAALLHDLGKLGVSNAILDKPGRLDQTEWTAVRHHPALSEDILARLGVSRELAPAAGAHHEWLDGKGYPSGLAGDAIPLRGAHHHRRRHLRCDHRQAPVPRCRASTGGAGNDGARLRHGGRRTVLFRAPLVRLEGHRARSVGG
ncbi:MAG: HD domain-containing protein [Rhodospirillales bacterium]|nr:HD domain-containing protein [Rhodospirillales bacterium]